MARSSQPTVSTGADSPHQRAESRRSRLLGPWRLDRLAARGLHTEIYTARPAAAGGDSPAAYAVKRLIDRFQSDPAVVGQFRREAAAGSEVSHPHLSSVLSARVAEPPYYLVMPWLTGVNLRELMTRGAGLCLPEMLCIARQAAEALAALFHVGWTHGDVKPENIIVSPPLHATLIDLGFARRSDAPGWAAEPYFRGTLNYVAPEVIVSAAAPDVRSDLYSLGVMIYELVSGRLPFAAGSPAAIARRRVQDVPADIHRLEPELPLDLVRLLRALLSKQPLRRPQSPEDVVQRLVRLEIETFEERASLRRIVTEEKRTTNGHE